MHVMVRVQMGGPSPEKGFKPLNLGGPLGSDLRGLADRSKPGRIPDEAAAAIHKRRDTLREQGRRAESEIEVKPKPQAREIANQDPALFQAGEIDHDRRAGHDAASVGLQNAPGHTFGQVEVIRIDDEQTRRHWLPLRACMGGGGPGCPGPPSDKMQSENDYSSRTTTHGPWHAARNFSGTYPMGRNPKRVNTGPPSSLRYFRA